MPIPAVDPAPAFKCSPALAAPLLECWHSATTASRRADGRQCRPSLTPPLADLPLPVSLRHLAFPLLPSPFHPKPSSPSAPRALECRRPRHCRRRAPPHRGAPFPALPRLQWTPWIASTRLREAPRPARLHPGPPERRRPLQPPPPLPVRRGRPSTSHPDPDSTHHGVALGPLSLFPASPPPPASSLAGKRAAAASSVSYLRPGTPARLVLDFQGFCESSRGPFANLCLCFLIFPVNL